MKWFNKNQFLLGMGIGLAIVLVYLPLLSFFWRSMILLNGLGLFALYKESQPYEAHNGKVLYEEHN